MGAWGVLWIWNLQIILSFIKNVPSGDVLGLAGYTQSSGTGELKQSRRSFASKWMIHPESIFMMTLCLIISDPGQNWILFPLKFQVNPNSGQKIKLSPIYKLPWPEIVTLPINNWKLPKSLWEVTPALIFNGCVHYFSLRVASISLLAWKEHKNQYSRIHSYHKITRVYPQWFK